jgi:preprotein translocase subunit SecB
MTDQTSPETPAADAGNGELHLPSIRVLAQFVKDLSFENPGLLTAAVGGGAPEIELSIDVRVDPGSPAEGVFGVDLRLSAKATRQETVVFICELVYAGLFQLQNAQPQDIEPMLLIECPRLLFPFARRIIGDVTRDGGHPPLLVDPIDFSGLYRSQKAQQAAAAAQG